MSIRHCPECGHELAGRCRYCQFCGCDLRRTPRTASPVSSPASGGNPYASGFARGNSPSGGRKLTVIVVLLVMAAIAASLVFYSRSHDDAAPPVYSLLRSGMGFEEASGILEENGFVRDGDPYVSGGAVTQNYDSHTAYGEKAFIVSLEVDEGRNGRVSLCYYYSDTDHGTDGRTPVFSRLKKELSSRYGDPEYRTAVYDHYYWPDADGYHMLFDTGDLIVLMEMTGK